MASEEDVLQCYCNVEEIEMEAPVLTCQKCTKKFHIECLKRGKPSPLLGDVFFHFKCEKCGDNGEEELQRMKMQWTQVVLLALYNLQMTGHVGKFGYYRWKEHICAYIDKHWFTLFGSHRKKTTLWHGTVAGTLSSGCPHHFTSGVNELGETGWWRLTHVRPPYIKHVPSGGIRSSRKKSTHPALPESVAKVGGLRCRRGKTSIAAAMELKAKRETLLEAKEIRKANAKSTSSSTSTSGEGTSMESSEGKSDVKRILSSLLTSQTSLVQYQQTSSQMSASQALSRPIKQEPGVSMDMSDSLDSSFAASQGSNISGNQSFHSSSGSASQSFLSESFKELDDDSQFSHASSTRTDSWFTEQDLKPQSNLPTMLMSDDQGGDSDSDLEIDPGTFTPPQSPLMREESPTLTDILSSVTNKSETQQDSNSLVHPSVIQEVLNNDHSYLSSTPSLLTTPSLDMSGVGFTTPVKDEEGEEEASVVDSESESEESEEDTSMKGVETARKRVIVKEEEKKVDTQPENKVRMMSVHEERQLLQKLNAAADTMTLPPETNRLRRKLIVRQLKRDNGVPIFDVDLEMNRLARKCWGQDWQAEDGKNNVRGQSSMMFPRGEVRVLDRFLTSVYNPPNIGNQRPSFLNRLVGTEDDQLHTIRSPYTARLLKPFIRRDYESRPLKMQLIEEIKAYPHRNDPSWKSEPPLPIDYCYVRPQHIPSVNNLCREFFWPGIDMSECLQYPDFSCIVLFRKVVIGFAFMVPDVKYNEAYISFLFTHPEWRRAGIAKFMLYHLIQTCMGKDVTLHVSATNPAMLLYQKFGFKQEELILDFYDKYYPDDTNICKHAFFLRLRR